MPNYQDFIEEIKENISFTNRHKEMAKDLGASTEETEEYHRINLIFSKKINLFMRKFLAGGQSPETQTNDPAFLSDVFVRA